MTDKLTDEERDSLNAMAAALRQVLADSLRCDGRGDMTKCETPLGHGHTCNLPAGHSGRHEWSGDNETAMADNGLLARLDAAYEEMKRGEWPQSFIARLDVAYDEMEATVRKLHDLMSENRQMRSRIKSEFKIP
jgi:hypothetical protein